MEPIEHRDVADGPKPSVIAIIDDDASIRHLLHDILADEGYQTILLAKATSAMDVIRNTRPDLIILDLWIEQADAGWKILDELRRNIATRHLPVIVCSANVFMLGTIAALRAAPQYVFLPKPFTAEDLLAKVEELLTARQLS